MELYSSCNDDDYDCDGKHYCTLEDGNSALSSSIKSFLCVADLNTTFTVLPRHQDQECDINTSIEKAGTQPSHNQVRDRIIIFSTPVSINVQIVDISPHRFTFELSL